MEFMKIYIRNAYAGSFFNRKILLCDFHITINKNDTIILAGPSGIGKSTFLSIIRGDSNFDGTISCNGSPQIRFVSQPLTIDTGETVEDAIQFAVLSNLSDSPHSADPFRVSRKVDKWLKSFDLLDKKKMKISQLSGGQKRRVMLCERFVEQQDQYDLLLCDEPDTGLDIKSQQSLHELMVRNARDNRKTLITVTHNLYPSNLCFYSKIILLGYGKRGIPTVRYFGPISDIKRSFGTTDFLQIFDKLMTVPA
ncbi:MAG: ATP-binding cassette domain-containing protein [Lachnospiraceae bacterium]|nr:ATP-binding cassette domain-containing protein [Lachnospiraceae bacterium]